MNLGKFSSSTTEAVVVLGNEENYDGILDNGKKKNSVVGETTLSGAEYVSCTVKNWLGTTNLGVSPCVPFRVFSINVPFAARAVSNDHIAILFQVLNKQHQRQRMRTHTYLKNLEDGVIANEISCNASDGGFLPGMLNEDRDVQDGDLSSKRLPFSNIIESIGGVPIHARDPGENSMARKRDEFLSTLKQKLDADERLICKMLIVLEFWMFGHPEARVYGVDFVAPGEEGRILRWQETLKDCIDSHRSMAELDLGARLDAINAAAAYVTALNSVAALNGSIAQANTSGTATPNTTNGANTPSASSASSPIPRPNVAPEHGVNAERSFRGGTNSVARPVPPTMTSATAASTSRSTTLTIIDQQETVHTGIPSKRMNSFFHTLKRRVSTLSGAVRLASEHVGSSTSKMFSRSMSWSRAETCLDSVNSAGIKATCRPNNRSPVAVVPFCNVANTDVPGTNIANGSAMMPANDNAPPEAERIVVAETNYYHSATQVLHPSASAVSTVDGVVGNNRIATDIALVDYHASVVTGNGVVGNGSVPNHHPDPGSVNLRFGRACNRNLMFHSLMALHLTVLPDHWYSKLDFGYSSFHENFRKFEEEFYLLVDKHNGDENKLNKIMREYGI